MELRKDIQGLRAIAVLFVFVFHLNSSWLPGGLIGVDMFFVISGFLISSIVLSKLNTNTFSFFDFYKSRVKRIVPAYYFLLIVIAAVSAFVFFSSDITALRKALFWSTLFDSNYYFSTLDTYFGAINSENPFLHTWTLAIEMQFYAFLPLLLFLIKRRWLILIVAIITVVLFVYGTIHVFDGNKEIMYFSLLARTPEFLIGVLASLVYNKYSLNGKRPLLLSAIGVVLLLVSVVFINENSYFPGLLSILPCLGTALLLVSPENKIRNFISNKIMFYIGGLSYSVYLWHWPVMAFFRYYNNSYQFTIQQVIIIIILVLCLSLFSYYCVENPIRNKADLKVWGRWVVLLGVANVAAVFFVIPINRQISDLPLSYTAPIFGINSHAKTFKQVEVLGDSLAIENDILLLGDSHALCMKYYLDYLGKRNKFSFKTITNDQYPTIPNLQKEESNGNGFYNQYINLMPYVHKEIEKSKIIILAYNVDGDRWLAPIIEMIRNLKTDQSFILFADFPRIDKNPIKINKGIIRDPSKDNFYKVEFPKVSMQIIKLIKSTPNCYYLDLTNSKAFVNVPFYNDTVMYYDEAHLNMYGAKVYAEDTEDKFVNLLNNIIIK